MWQAEIVNLHFRLQELRDEMIDKGPARSVINKRIGMLKRMFRWAASQQLVPVTVYQALATVENLRAGRYRAKEHKTAYRGHTRLIAIGPKGQTILRPFLKRKLDDYCFKPAEEYGGQRRYNDCYDRNSYRRMIQYGIKAANKDGKEIPHWHPHQLRHTAGTKVRKELGREAARAFLGHRNPQITDDYAEIDFGLAEKASLLLG